MKTTEKLDYKKAFKELYQPGGKPAAVNVPEMTFIAVDGRGDPNVCPEYKEAMEILYGMSFTIKMSKLSGNAPKGYFEYTVPPLEGLWHTEEGAGIKCPEFGKTADKSKFCWTSMIRQPEFVTEEVFEAARAALGEKKPSLDLSKARLLTFTEGLCVQIMHKGAYDNEEGSIEKLREFMRQAGYKEDISPLRRHHEIYLSDPRRCAVERLRTVIRIPCKRLEVRG